MNAARNLSPMELSNTSLVPYVIDAVASRFTVRAYATGLLSMLGHSPIISVNNFAGDIHLAQDSLAGANLHLNINAASLAIEGQINDKDRREMERTMNAEVLEVSRFPDIAYDCSSVSGNKTGPAQYEITLNGQLTLHGITRALPVNARVSIAGAILRASGQCILRQTDYGIKLVSAMAGTLRIKDDLKLTFDLAARRQKED